MRTIKFRGMCANEIMRYGQLSQDKPDSTNYYHEYSQRICWDFSNVPVTNVSLTQFTGAKDCNDKEIYEGDICKVPDGKIGKVVYSDNLTSFLIIVDRFLYNASYPLIQEQDGVNKVEVLGNIFENPELLED